MWQIVLRLVLGEGFNVYILCNLSIVFFKQFLSLGFRCCKTPWVPDKDIGPHLGSNCLNLRTGNEIKHQVFNLCNQVRERI